MIALRRLGESTRVVVAMVVVALVSTMFVASWGGSAHAAKQAKADPNGTFVLPSDTSAVHWDPAKAPSSGALWATAMYVYDGLARLRIDGPSEPGLAKSIKIVDPSTIDIEIRQGVKFTDGAAFTPEVVKMNLERTLAAANQVPTPGSYRADTKLMQSITVTGPSTVQVKLSQPQANTFLPVLQGVEGAMISPNALKNPAINLDTTPVGAGPFKLVSYVPGQTIELVKNPDYWDAANVKWGKLLIPNIVASTTTGNTALINAISAGQISYQPFQQPSDIDSLDAAGVKYFTMSGSTSAMWSNMCMNRAPLDNLKVRQAIQYATDRDAFNKLWAAGRGEVAWSLYPKNDKIRHVPALDNFYPHNVKKAKQLLAEAGYPNGIDIKMIVVQGGPSNAEILQQQWKEAGIRLEIVPTANAVSDLLLAPSPKADMGVIALQRAGLERLTLTYQVPGITNLCSYNDPQLNALIDGVKAATPGSADEKQAYAKAERYILENALNAFYLFPPLAIAWNDKTVGGVEEPNALITQSPIPPNPNFRVIYVKKQS